MCGINVSPKSRYYDLGGVNPGNGTIKVTYQDTEDGRTVFAAYRVSLYVDCEMEDNLWKETAIVTTFTIEQPKQVRLFGTRIPRETENIIGDWIGIDRQRAIPHG